MKGKKLLKAIVIEEAHDRDVYARISKDVINLLLEQAKSDKMFNYTTTEIILPVESCEIDDGEIFLNLKTDDDMPF